MAGGNMLVSHLLPGTGSVGDVVEEAARLEQLLRKPPVFQLLLP